MSGLELKNGFVQRPVSPSVPEMEGIYATVGQPFLRMCLWWSLCTLYLLAYQVTFMTGDSGLCSVCVLFIERLLAPLFQC